MKEFPSEEIRTQLNMIEFLILHEVVLLLPSILHIISGEREREESEEACKKENPGKEEEEQEKEETEKGTTKKDMSLHEHVVERKPFQS